MSGNDFSIELPKPGGRYRIAKLLAVFLLSPVVLTFLLPVAFHALTNLIALTGWRDLLYLIYGVDRFFSIGLNFCMFISWLAGPLAYAVNGGGYSRRHSAVRYALFGGAIGAVVSIFVLLAFGIDSMEITLTLTPVGIGQGVLYALWLWACLRLFGLLDSRSEVDNADR